MALSLSSALTDVVAHGGEGPGDGGPGGGSPGGGSPRAGSSGGGGPLSDVDPWTT